MIKNINLESIKSISCDSRTMKKGDVFVAIPCEKALSNAMEAYHKEAGCLIAEHGIAKALRQKITDVVLQADNTDFIGHPRVGGDPDLDSRFRGNDSCTWNDKGSGIEIISVDNARLIYSQICSQLYPKQPSTIAAVTGTNGKSSVVHMVYQLWKYLGLNAASLGTLGLQCNKKLDLKIPALTTLDALSFHKIMNDLGQQNINYLAFEASSHGLDQYRCHQAKLSAAGFTNLTQDHLDYHKNMDEYFAAKTKLFTEVLDKNKVAIINAMDTYDLTLIDLLKKRKQNIITYAVSKDADLMAKEVIYNKGAIQFDLHYQGRAYLKQTLNCIGSFQLENLLCALGLVIACSQKLEDLIEIIPKIKPVNGRMELVGTQVWVDYAHTPDSLKRALESMRKHVSGKLWVVFGCGGNRDQTKRPLMGQIAGKLADQVVVTDDNPRFEEPSLIRAQIIQECSKAIEIADRRKAIQYAVQNLQKDDGLLIAGKGHEIRQIIGDKIEDFDDAIEVQKVLA